MSIATTAYMYYAHRNSSELMHEFDFSLYGTRTDLQNSIFDFLRTQCYNEFHGS